MLVNNSSMWWTLHLGMSPIFSLILMIAIYFTGILKKCLSSFHVLHYTLASSYCLKLVSPYLITFLMTPSYSHSLKMLLEPLMAPISMHLLPPIKMPCAIAMVLSQPTPWLFGTLPCDFSIPRAALPRHNNHPSYQLWLQPAGYASSQLLHLLRINCRHVHNCLHWGVSWVSVDCQQRWCRLWHPYPLMSAQRGRSSAQSVIGCHGAPLVTRNQWAGCLLQLCAHTGGPLLSRADVKLEVGLSPLADVEELATRERGGALWTSRAKHFCLLVWRFVRDGGL